MKEGTSPEGPKARESRGEPRVGRVRGSGPCRGVIERPGGSRHDSRFYPGHMVYFYIKLSRLGARISLLLLCSTKIVTVMDWSLGHPHSMGQGAFPLLPANSVIISTANAAIKVLQFVSISQPSLYHL